MINAEKLISPTPWYTHDKMCIQKVTLALRKIMGSKHADLAPNQEEN